MSKRILFSTLCLGLIFSLLAACTPAATPAPAGPTQPPAAAPTQPPAPAATEPTGPQVFRVAISTNIDTFDPHGTRSFAVANVVDFMVDTLIKADVDGNIVPWLAESWEYADEGKEIIFHLRDGVEFSDGTPFDAEAVKYNLDRFNDPEVLSATKFPYNLVKETIVVDPLTVKFRLDAPSNQLLPAFSNTNIAMISPASIPAGSEAYIALGDQAPVGSGPYVLKEYVKDDHVTVTRNPNYWGEPPYYDEFEFYIVPEAATRESLLLSGEVDLAVAPPITDLPALETNPDVVVMKGISNRVIFLGINTTHEYLKDPKVRQALNYAIDKEAIVKNVLLGNAEAVVSPMPKGFFGFCETQPVYTYDPEKAKAMLEEAGVPEGLELRFYSSTGRYLQDFQVSEAVAGYLGKVGIQANVQTTDWGSYMSLLTGKQPEEVATDLYFLGWAGGYPHGSHTMTMFQTGTFFNAGFYSNPEVDELVQLADSTADMDQSAEYYCQANQTVWEEAPWIFLYQQGYPVIHSAGVTGIIVLPSEKFDLFSARPAQ